ncbi:type 1 fimbrial protein [Enterobacter roggenkampii]|uniref:Fimbrial protein n=1 Tax=Enterobacter roggenkampii TaxID=1812935 RepID=A0ABD7KC11_9ENTR|nr:fimbrial protein [Enterobacter roggenkampii]RWS72953.1 type 1 fimbrial protein [Enterobacter cloacae]MCB7499536.1 type 1 fimbrial protein [Enterobacter roggenkampii]MCE5965775.1 type 1 fimbrial protein [Enterobacter roggenkampii]MCE5970207.1 type 1 fimbrial protein [Enterobacter roggenkampii]MCM7156466.1 type 1 fimbrial protein [Enterobacter roggenkampii]
MTLTRLALAAAIAASGLSAAQASTGTVNFSGSIVTASCSIASGEGGDASNIDMGQIGNAILEASGNTGETAPKPFTIKLEGCALGNGANTVSAKFTGVASSADPKSFALNGTASGAHLVLTEKDGTKIGLGEDSVAQRFGRGDMTLEFAAKLKGDGSTSDDTPALIPIVPGSFTVPVTFALTYN